MYSLKFAKSLQDKKTRKEEQMFLVEWEKSLVEALNSDLAVVYGFFTQEFSDTYSEILRRVPHEIISTKELQKATSLVSNTSGILIVRMKKQGIISDIHEKKNLLILDGINDPGNLGTIIRIADWYGIDTIIASPDTVDVYNPKTIIASMGSFARVNVEYRELGGYLGGVQSAENTVHRVVYGAYLEWTSIRTKKFTSDGWYLVIGSESHGIRPYLESYITDRITIPRFGQAESLNAGVATAVILERMTE